MSRRDTGLTNGPAGGARAARIDILPRTIADLKALQALGRRTYSDAFGPYNTPEDMALYLESAFSEERLLRELSNPESLFLFLHDDGELSGYIKLNWGGAQSDLKDPDALEIERIYVLSGRQGRGLGEALVARAFEEARARGKSFVWLGVWEKNPRAIRFYERMGFRKFGEHEFVLGTDRQTDHLMRRDIAAQPQAR